jgi:hypothetical protein
MCSNWIWKDLGISSPYTDEVKGGLHITVLTLAHIPGLKTLFFCFYLGFLSLKDLFLCKRLQSVEKPFIP